MQSRLKVLDNLYEQLGYDQGDLIKISDTYRYLNTETWIEKGNWLSLAEKANSQLEGAKINGIYFVNDNPVIVFGECDCLVDNEEEVIKMLYKKVWSMSRPSLFFLAFHSELRVYGLNRLPQIAEGRWKLPEPIDQIKEINRVAESLRIYRREEIESGRIWNQMDLGSKNGHADTQLIRDLKIVRTYLSNEGLSDDRLKYAHYLIGRSIFIRYLEDRGILTEEYFRKIANENDEWVKLLQEPLLLNLLDIDVNKQFFFKVLGNKDFTYRLFERLTYDFNGGLFPVDEIEQNIVTQHHLDMLRKFLTGDLEEQGKLFLWAYSFDIIPTELISSIYEEFYHTEIDYENVNDSGTHYTPSVLVDFVLSNILTVERLSCNPRVLDPACGSGIFLVEAYKRIVRYQMKIKGIKKLSSEELREILRNQIAGIEINEEAARISSFALCLSYLDYLDPPDILYQIQIGNRLPNLRFTHGTARSDKNYNIILNNDAFNMSINSIDGFTSQSFDIVIGNPPWGEADLNAEKWCKENERPLGDKEYSQAFIWRTIDFLKKCGCGGLLVSTGVFFKQNKNSQAFRKQWLQNIRINKVVNFAHVRDIFFSGAIAPFAFVQFEKKLPDSNSIVKYWSAKKTVAIGGHQSVVLNKIDLKAVKQSDLYQHDILWKVYWWGSHRDRALIGMLFLEKTLDDFVKERNWPKGYGFQGKRPKAKNVKSQWLLQYKELPVQKFNSFGSIDHRFLKQVPEEVYRLGQEQVYSGWRILFKRGVTQANGQNGIVKVRLEDEPYCFRHSIYGIKVENAKDYERKIILGILWSSLSRYYLFHTSRSWGTWHHSAHLEDILNIPIRIPEDERLRAKIVNLVDKLRNLENDHNGLFLSSNNETQSDLIRNELDEAIFDLFDLSLAERVLVNDLCNVELDFFYNHLQSRALKSLTSSIDITKGFLKDIVLARSNNCIYQYVEVFLKIWNEELEPDGEFSWNIIGIKSNMPMIAMVFTTQEKGAELEKDNKDEQEEWNSLLTELNNNLLTPYCSANIFIDGIVRYVTDTEIYIIKRNEYRLWTQSMAVEDAEATLLQAMNMQEVQGGKEL